MGTNAEPLPGAGPDPAAGDAELLAAAATGDRAAADRIVRRHGPTVLAVCRGVLGAGPDADDAFQATFLVLVRRAGRVRKPAALGGWLCGVAARVARRSRRRRSRDRGAQVTTANDLPARGPADPLATAIGRESEAVLWAELGGLPEAYRAPLVLCHLEGRTTEAAAAALGCPVGTLRSRLLKARQLLGARLTRRGVTLSAAAALACLAGGRAAAAPPAGLIDRAATTAAGGPAPPAVSQLAEGVMRELTTGWWPVAGLGALVAGTALLVALSGGVAAPGPGTPPADEQPAAKAGPGDRPVGRAAGAGTLLVVSQRDATVALIDPSTGKTRATVKTDPCPHEVAVSPDGRTAAVSNYGLPFGKVHGCTVTLIDVVAGKAVGTVELAAGAAPHGLHWVANDRLLCTTEAAAAVVEIDATQGKVARTIRTDQKVTHMVAAAPGARRAFTANVLSDTVSAVDLGEGAKLKDKAVGKGPEGIAVSPDGRRVWVGNRGDKTVTVLAADDLSVLKTLPAPGVPLRIAFTPDGKSALVTEIAGGELSVFDAEKLTETKRVKLAGGKVAFDTPGPPPGPAGVAVSPDGKTAYCTVFFSKAVAVIDLSAGAVTGKIPVEGGEPDGIALSPVGPKE